jgi:4-amino-4-deoxy-L-arabinose transferase-like glycosyltransferase
MREEPKKNSFLRREKSIFWIFFAVYFILGLLYVFLGRFWADESWYFGGSWLVAGGQVPYRDFFIHHNPVFFYIYALPQHFFGPSIIVGRLTSLVIMMLTFVLLWRLARKLGGKTAAIVAGGLLITNIFLAYYYITFSYHVLEAFFMLIFFSILFGGLRETIKYPLATLLLCLVVGIRYPIDIVTGLLGLYLIYVIFHCRHHKQVILLSLAVAVVSLGAILLSFIIMARDQYFFGTVTYDFFTLEFWAEFGLMGVPDIINRIYHALVLLCETFRTFYAVAAVLLSLLFYSIFKKVREKAKLKELITKNQGLFFMIIFILLFEIFCAAAYLSSVTLRTFTFPAAAILAGVGLSKVLADIKDKSAAWLLNGLIIALIVLTPLAQYGQGGESRPAVKWNISDMKYILDVSDKVADYTHEGDSVLTFTPPLALQADRKLMPGMAMELLNFFPTWETQKCQKYNLLNLDMLLDYLASRKAGAVVQTEFRFYSGKGQGKILDKYRTDIIRVLEENYYLAETVPYPPEIGLGNVYIYLRRSP